MLRRGAPRLVLVCEFASQATVRRIQLEQATAAAVADRADRKRDRAASSASAEEQREDSRAPSARLKQRQQETASEARSAREAVAMSAHSRLRSMLGCPPRCSGADLKAAYYSKAKELHPDAAGPGAAAQFAALSELWQEFSVQQAAQAAR